MRSKTRKNTRPLVRFVQLFEPILLSVEDVDKTCSSFVLVSFRQKIHHLSVMVVSALNVQLQGPIHVGVSFRYYVSQVLILQMLPTSSNLSSDAQCLWLSLKNSNFTKIAVQCYHFCVYSSFQKVPLEEVLNDLMYIQVIIVSINIWNVTAKVK